MAQDVYILSARRSPMGRLGGALATLPLLRILRPVARSVIPEAAEHAVEQIILGHVLPAGHGMNPARQLVLEMGLPLSTSAFAVNQVCASGLRAVMLASQSIALGETRCVLAGGVESMSRTPHYHRDLRRGVKAGDVALVDGIFSDGLVDPCLGIRMGDTAENLAQRFAIARSEQDAWALGSQRKAAEAREATRRERTPLAHEGVTIAEDEPPRPDTTLEGLAALKPAFAPDGTVTAGNSSGISDGAALLLLGSSEAARMIGLSPRARIVAHASIGCDPATMGLGPVGAIRLVLARAGWRQEDVDAIEINEAFAVQVLACIRELDLEPARVNRRGGAIALGHPLGCSGARILVTLLHLLEDLGLRRGIAGLCVGGGQGVAVAIERIG